MADYLQANAEAVMGHLETRFGVAATYTKKGTPTVSAAGAITPVNTVIACTLVPGQLTHQEVVALGNAYLEQTVRVYKARASVLGAGPSKGDTVTIAGSIYEVVAPVALDALQITYRLLTREIA